MSRKLSSWKNKKIIVERTKTDIVGTIGEILFFMIPLSLLNGIFIDSLIGCEHFLFWLSLIIVLDIVLIALFYVNLDLPKEKVVEELYIREVKDE